jgi:hypothetical protein
MFGKVWISYLQQVIFAIAICLLLAASYISGGHLPRRYLPKRVCDAMSKKRATLQSILVEFQEAQCYFMIASQAAILSTFVQDSRNFDAVTYAQLQGDRELAALIGYAAILPTTYVMLNLCSFGMSSWYTLVLSVTTLVLGTATLGGILNVPEYADPNIGINNNPLLLDPGFAFLDKCGMNPPPIVYCTPIPPDSSLGNILPAFGYTNDWSPDTSAFDSLILLCWLVHAAIVVYKLLSYPFAARFQKPFHKPIMVWVVRVISVLCHATFLAYLSYYLAVLVYMGFQIDKASWSLGQIIAVAVWAPVLGKLFYLLLCKSPILTDCAAVA